MVTFFFFSNEGSWERRDKMSETFRSTAVWTVTWKYWRKHYDFDTWLLQHLTHLVSWTSQWRATQRPAKIASDYSHCSLLFMSGCYPFYQKDPFILEECPHVYFSGNAPTFGSKLIKGQCLMCYVHAKAVIKDNLRLCFDSQKFVHAQQQKCINLSFKETFQTCH